MRIILPQYHVAWGYLFSEYAKEICKSAFLLWTGPRQLVLISGLLLFVSKAKKNKKITFCNDETHTFKFSIKLTSKN